MCWHVGLFNKTRHKRCQENLLEARARHSTHALPPVRCSIQNIIIDCVVLDGDSALYFDGGRWVNSCCERYLRWWVHAQITFHCEVVGWLFFQDGSFLGIVPPAPIKLVCDWLQVRIQQRLTFRVVSSPDQLRNLRIISQWLHFKPSGAWW